MAKKNGNRVYRPQRTFDDSLFDVAAFFRRKGLSLDGIDAVALLGLGETQRDERQEDGRLAGEADAFHQQFIRDQAARHVTYMKALKLARAKYDGYDAVLAELEHFRRHVGRGGKPVDGGAPQDK